MQFRVTGQSSEPLDLLHRKWKPGCQVMTLIVVNSEALLRLSITHCTEVHGMNATPHSCRMSSSSAKFAGLKVLIPRTAPAGGQPDDQIGTSLRQSCAGQLCSIFVIFWLSCFFEKLPDDTTANSCQPSQPSASRGVRSQGILS